MMHPRLPMSAWLIRSALAAWLAVAVVAAGAMYRLWATREWKMYGRRSVAEQRSALFAYVGFDTYLLRDAQAIRVALPPNTDYRTEGDLTRLSYVKYLLVPRTPRDTATVTIRDTGSSLVLDPALAATPPTRTVTEGPQPHALILAAALVLGIGAGLRSIWPKCLSMPQAALLGLLAGMGAVTISRSAFGTAIPGFWVWTAAGIAGCCLAATKLRLKHPKQDDNPPRRFVTPMAAFLLLLGGTYVFWSLLMAVVVVPDDWDAWAIWGAKAKALALGKGPLDRITPFGSPEYPLLWPSLWAFTGWLAGGWEEQWAKGWGAVLLSLTAWQIVVHQRGEAFTRLTVADVLPAVLFVAMPFVSLTASWAYAEPAYWLALACAWSALADLRRQPSARAAIVAGLLLAAAMHTKNEGAVFAAIATLWLLAQRNVRWTQTLATCATAAFVFLPWFAWTRWMQGFNTTSTGGFMTVSDAVHRLSSAWLPTTVQMLRISVDPRLWGLGLAGLVILAVWTAIRGDAFERRGLLVVACMFLAYALVVLLGSNDPVWQVGMAWSRLTTHMLLLTLMVTGERLRNETP